LKVDKKSIDGNDDCDEDDRDTIRFAVYYNFSFRAKR
jgi:hypothetical protein